MNLFKDPRFLKVVALALALATYFYIHEEVKSADEAMKILDPSYKLIKLTAKTLPLKVRLATSPREGYRILTADVTSNPSKLVVIGPEALLEEASSIQTALVDVSEYTKTVVREIPLESVAGIHLSGEPYVVEITVPIEKEPEKAS